MVDRISDLLTGRTRNKEFSSLSAAKLLELAKENTANLEALLDIAFELTFHRKTKWAAGVLTQVGQIISSCTRVVPPSKVPAPSPPIEDPSPSDPETNASLKSRLNRTQTELSALQQELANQASEHKGDLARQKSKLEKWHDTTMQSRLRAQKTRDQSKIDQLKQQAARQSRWKSQLEGVYIAKAKELRCELDDQIRLLKNHLQEFEYFYKPENPTLEENALLREYRELRKENIEAIGVAAKEQHKKKTTERHKNKCGCSGEVENCDRCYGQGFYFVDGYGNPVTR